MDVIFDKTVSRNEIEKYEKDCLEKVFNFSLMSVLKEELDGRGWHFGMEIQHIESDLKKYSSHLAIDIYNESGERVYEIDEPACCLMLCEPICYMRRGRVVGVDLIADKEFIQSLESLIKQVKNAIN